MMSEKTNRTSGTSGGKSGGGCLELPKLQRLNYFFGQMLSAQDFATEQHFFREKLKLHNRCLHGYGVVCGLLVEPVPIPKSCDAKEEAEEKELWEELEKLLAEKTAGAAAPPQPAPQQAAAAPAAGGQGAQDAVPGQQANAPAAPADAAPVDLDAEIETLRRRLGEFYRDHCKEEPRTCVRIGCGLALDCHGNELIVNQPLAVDLAQAMSAADYRRVKQGAHEVYISICYCEQATDPVRPVVAGPCDAMAGCTYGRWQEGVRVAVTVDPPARDGRCSACCEACEECCLLLARVECFFPGHELHEHHIHNEVRRGIGLYAPTTVVGVSWKFAHEYTAEEARRLMGTHDRGQPHGRGLEIRFSGPVRAATIRPGVVDTWVVQGKRGRSGDICNKPGQLVDHPEDGWVDRIFYRDTTDETLEPGDRVLVTLRTNFILDRCCRPVDGENVGGRVPVLDEYAEHYGLCANGHEECCVPAGGYGPWRSGSGVHGGVFESWFYIRERDWEPNRQEKGRGQ
jgi:hypothetical protein